MGERVTEEGEEFQDKRKKLIDSEDGAEAEGAEHTDNHTGEGDTAYYGQHALFEVHVEEAGSQGAGPGAGAGQRDADEKKQGHV